MSASESEAARLRRILGSLPIEDVTFLARHPLPRWAVQARRRGERNRVIYEARRFLQGMGDWEQARKLSWDLRCYIASAWQCGSGVTPLLDTYRGTLHRIAFLNHGVPLGPDTICKVFRGTSGDDADVVSEKSARQF